MRSLTLEVGQKVVCMFPIKAKYGVRPELGSTYTVRHVNMTCPPEFVFAEIDGSWPAHIFLDRAHQTEGKLQKIVDEQTAPKKIQMLATVPSLGRAFYIETDQNPEGHTQLDGTELQQFVDEVVASTATLAQTEDYLVQDNMKMLYAWGMINRHGSDAPEFPSFRDMLVRVHLLTEEASELAHAMAQQDMVEVLDALADLDVILTGTWIKMGLYKARRAASAEVLRSNLTKVNRDTGVADHDESGRILKGPSYERPDFAKVIKITFGEHTWRVSEQEDAAHG